MEMTIPPQTHGEVANILKNKQEPDSIIF